MPNMYEHVIKIGLHNKASMSDGVAWHRRIVFFLHRLKRLAAMKAVGCRAQWNAKVFVIGSVVWTPKHLKSK